MPEPIHVPLSLFHQQRLNGISLEIVKAEATVERERALFNEVLSSVVGVGHDPRQLLADGWTFRQDLTEIVIIPPPAQADAP